MKLASRLLYDFFTNIIGINVKKIYIGMYRDVLNPQ